MFYCWAWEKENDGVTVAFAPVSYAEVIWPALGTMPWAQSSEESGAQCLYLSKAFKEL